MPGRVVTCRYLKAYNTQCTAEAVDAGADIMLCARHLAEAMRLAREAMGNAATRKSS